MLAMMVCVLILVLMEDTLGVYSVRVYDSAMDSLNPCSNGKYSRSRALYYKCRKS